MVCGDFNAGPDSDEIRMLTGRSTTAAPGLHRLVIFRWAVGSRPVRMRG
jgi:endonuclease/exonuclease/phosphatase family metal-dependent hydrolase